VLKVDADTIKPHGFVVYNAKKDSYTAEERLDIALVGSVMHMTAGEAIGKAKTVEYDADNDKVLLADGTNPTCGFTLDKAAQDTDLIRVYITAMPQNVMVLDDITAVDDLVVNDDLTVVGAATVGETLDVTGASTLTGGVTAESTLSVAGATTLTGAVTLGTDELTATEINAVADVSGRLVNLTAATLTMTAALHGERVVTVNKADGATITLPAATGTGQKYSIYVGTTITSVGLVIQAASAADSFTGFAYGADTDAEGATGFTWNADSGDDTITMDGAAQGGIAGDRVDIIDIASGIFSVTGYLTQSGGSEATPFSAAVS
jgi:hypothetical protein